MAEQQAEGSAAAEVQQCAQHEAGAETAAYATHEEPKDNPYLHRHGMVTDVALTLRTGSQH
jgi:hypothetical protein